MTLYRGIPDEVATAMIDVTVLFLDEGHVSTAIGPLEIFRDTGVLWGRLTGEPAVPRFRVRSASIGGRPVRAGAPYEIHPDESLERIARTDLVFVPSGGVDLDTSLARNEPVIRFLRKMRKRGSRIAGVCSGVALLAAADLLDGKIATSHWALVPLYRERFPAVDWRPESLVTESDGIYCGGGVHAALDLALYLVEKLCDRTTAMQCAKALLIDMPRTCQAGFAVLPLGRRHGDEVIRRAEEWIHRHCREPLRFEALARELGMSPRNFIRRFKQATGLAPTDYLQRLRIHAAKRFLEEDRIGVQEVGVAVGYTDPAFFRSLFKRHTGLPPATYRRQFGPGAVA
jgi:transcriptional regulator GlxA family with amidase domain